jgi:hypothetical protein
LKRPATEFGENKRKVSTGQHKGDKEETGDGEVDSHEKREKVVEGGESG